MSDTDRTLALSWNGGSAGSGRMSSAFVSGDLAMPAGHGGTGQGLDPKSLLAAAAAECLLLNLVAVLEVSGVEHDSLSVSTSAQGGGDAMISIAHHIRLDLKDSKMTQDRISRLIDKAEAGCNVGNLLKSAGVSIHVTHAITAG